jgi:hypothetical protein
VRNQRGGLSVDNKQENIVTPLPEPPDPHNVNITLEVQDAEVIFEMTLCPRTKEE